MRPRLADYVLSMPRGAQIMYPKDIAQVIQLGDIRSGMRVLESGAGSGAMSVNLLDAVGERGHLTTIELRPEFAKVAQANATLYYGEAPSWSDLKTGRLRFRCRRTARTLVRPHHARHARPVEQARAGIPRDRPRRRVGQLRNYHHADEPHGRSPARGRLLDRAAESRNRSNAHGRPRASPYAPTTR